MNNIDSPKKLLYFITIPQSIMAIILAIVFSKIKEPLNLPLIIIFALQFTLNLEIVLYYIRNSKSEKISIKALYAFLISFIVLFSCATILIFQQFSSSSVISPETLYLLLNLISLIYLSLAIIKQTNSNNKDNSAMIILCLILPFAIYLLLSSYYTIGDISIVFAVGLFCIFLFLLSKLIYMLLHKNKKEIQTQNSENITSQTQSPESITLEASSKKYRIFLFILAVILPQVGLYVNNFTFWRLLGNFTNVYFYIIAAANGLLLLVDINKIKYKKTVFFLRTAGLIYIFYFALIFLPYMPYAFIGAIFWGMGLLVYVPILIFIVQTKQIYEDYKILKSIYSKKILVRLIVAGIFTLPAILMINFSIDRINFNRAMAYVNHDSKQQAKVDLRRLGYSISEIEETLVSSRERQGLTFLPGTPIISTAYRSIALDNMYFTEGTVESLQKIFMPEDIVSVFENLPADAEVNTGFRTKLSVSSTEYDPESKTYKAWVDLAIDKTSYEAPNEYSTKFKLPDGCFIVDYYLYVGSEKKRGIMTDKRAAQVAYESIIRTPKDPGIIYYDNDNTIALRVFPFFDMEVRRTGFQIMYSQNETLEIDGQTITLEAEHFSDSPTQISGVHFIPANYKKTLNSIQRKPLYYFLMDAGENSGYKENFELAKKHAKEKNLTDVKYYAVSYQAAEVTDLENTTSPTVPKGGFNTAYAMDMILNSVPEGYFPVMIMVTQNINRSVPYTRTQRFNNFPESEYSYRLNVDSSLTPYNLFDSEMLQNVNQPLFNNALDYQGLALKDDGKSETIFINPKLSEIEGDRYKRAFILQKNSYTAGTNDEQISQIKESMKQRILTKNTAFMVMETKEQEDMLLELQDKFLSGGSFETPSVMMSESDWTAIIAIIGFVFILKYKFRIGKNMQ